jgi:hypothetical protein
LFRKNAGVVEEPGAAGMAIEKREVHSMKKSLWFFLALVFCAGQARGGEVGFCLEVKGIDPQEADRARNELTELLRALGLEASDLGEQCEDEKSLGQGRQAVLEVGCLRVGSLVSFSLKVKRKSGTPCEARKTKSTSGELISPFREVFEQCLSWMEEPEKPSQSTPLEEKTPPAVQPQVSSPPKTSGSPAGAASLPVAEAVAQALPGPAPASVKAAAPVRASSYRKWGHVAFWSGVGLAAFGGFSAFMAKEAAEDHRQSGTWDDKNRSRNWAGMMYAGFGLGAAAMAAGVVLWLLSPSDRQWSEKQGAQLSLAPYPEGASVSLSWRW